MTTPDAFLPGGFWRRATAHLIDALAIFGASLVLALVLSPFMSQRGLQVGLTMLAAAYYVFFLAGPWQATFGKRVMDVFVVTAEDGSPLAVSRALLRYFLYSGIFIVLLLTGTANLPTPPESLKTAEMQRYAAILQTPEARRSYEEQREMLAIRERNRPALEAYEAETRAAITSPAFWLPQLFISVYGIGIILSVALSPGKAGWHDRLCGTRVIRGRPDAPKRLQPIP